MEWGRAKKNWNSAVVSFLPLSSYSNDTTTVMVILDYIFDPMAKNFMNYRENARRHTSHTVYCVILRIKRAPRARATVSKQQHFKIAGQERRRQTDKTSS